jgi:hypothetical protein
MLPAPPLPNDLTFRRHLHKIGRVHFAIFILGAGPATLDFGNNVIRKRLRADEKNVSVP